MAPQVIVSAHAPVEITKPRKVVLRYAVLDAGVCFGVMNEIKGQTIQRIISIRGIDVNLNYYYYYYYYYYYCVFHHLYYSQIIKIKIKIYSNFALKIYKTSKPQHKVKPLVERIKSEDIFKRT